MKTYIEMIKELQGLQIEAIENRQNAGLEIEMCNDYVLIAVFKKDENGNFQRQLHFRLYDNNGRHKICFPENKSEFEKLTKWIEENK
ncbi:hypothetical protein Barb6XT_03203 [Bacteroidales bacterium Barb6XT]|nr:hypothetical protein Barb6XT_03203 [Bacteroidales bacterium Barb6XT]